MILQKYAAIIILYSFTFNTPVIAQNNIIDSCAVEKDSSFKKNISATHKTKNDTLYIKALEISNESELASNDFLKNWIPSIVSLIVLMVTNFVLIYKIRLDTRAAIKKDLVLSKIKLDRERLEKFYDPIYTTLKSNADMFISFGHKSFAEDDHLRIEAADVWNLMVRNVIIPNNKKITNTITSFSHLIIPQDNLDNYLNFLKHAESYEHFILFPNTIHKNFKYPIDLITNVERNRTFLVSQIDKQEHKLLK